MIMADTSKPIPSIPKETARAANASFGRSNFHILIGEHMEAILEDIQLNGPTDKGGNTKTEGDIFALITFFQFVEGLTDMQAVDAVRTRTDWKFALHLSLIPAIFRESDLCEFRQRLLTEGTTQLEFQKLIDRLAKFVPSIKHNFQNLKSLEVISLVCSLNRLHRAQEAMHQALEVLAARFPEWLRRIALPHWYGRYNHATPRLEVAILLGHQRFLMEEIGADIYHLLDEAKQTSCVEICELHEIKALNQVWSQQYEPLNLTHNHWPENLNWSTCDTCPYKTAEKRRPA